VILGRACADALFGRLMVDRLLRARIVGSMQKRRGKRRGRQKCHGRCHEGNAEAPKDWDH
jgi:hypothetical protein